MYKDLVAGFNIGRFKLKENIRVQFSNDIKNCLKYSFYKFVVILDGFNICILEYKDLLFHIYTLFMFPTYMMHCIKVTPYAQKWRLKIYYEILQYVTNICSNQTTPFHILCLHSFIMSYLHYFPSPASFKLLIYV